MKLPGIGAKIADKICEIISTGHLQKADKMAGDERVQTMELFNDIWGVGPTTALEWYNKGKICLICSTIYLSGYRTLDDIRKHAKLSHQQEIGLRYYDEFLKRIPRDEATEIVEKVNETLISQVYAALFQVTNTVKSILPGGICTACGSYRRGQKTCGDVDFIITHEDGQSHANVLGRVVDSLSKDGKLCSNGSLYYFKYAF
jgi:DNA polymerase lambda